MPKTIYTQYHYVYRLTNKNPDSEKKYYIGLRTSKTCYPTEDTKYMSSSKYVKDAINNGEEFDKKVLCILETREEAERVERELQIILNVAKDSSYYNKHIHGEGWDNFGKVATDKTKARMSESRKGMKFSSEHKKKLSVLNRGENNAMYGLLGENNPNFGRICTDQTKINISKSLSGRIISDGVKNSETYLKRNKKISEFKKGKKHTKESKNKMSISHTGKIVSDETKKKLSIINTGTNNGFYGKTHTEESKLKSRDTRKKNEKILTCPHCNKISNSQGNMSRWHFDNCKKGARI